MSLAQIQQEDRRLCLLRFLHEDTDYCLNESLLREALKTYGHNLSAETLRAELEWLAASEQQLVALERLPKPSGGQLWVATLTLRGADVATGAQRVPGVKRPSPGM